VLAAVLLSDRLLIEDDVRSDGIAGVDLEARFAKALEVLSRARLARDIRCCRECGAPVTVVCCESEFGDDGVDAGWAGDMCDDDGPEKVVVV